MPSEPDPAGRSPKRATEIVPVPGMGAVQLTSSGPASIVTKLQLYGRTTVTPHGHGERMDRAVRSEFGGPERRHDGAEQPTRAEALVQLRGFTVTGALDHLEFSLAPASGEGPPTLVVDLSQASHLSSTTVEALLWIERCATARGIDVAIRNASPIALDTMQHTGLVDLVAGQNV